MTRISNIICDIRVISGKKVLCSQFSVVSPELLPLGQARGA